MKIRTSPLLIPPSVLLVLLTMAVSSSPAATLVWTNTTGGTWSTADNWNPNQVPSDEDTAVITQAGTYTVDLNSSPIVTDLVLGGTSGTQSLAINGQTLNVTGLGTINSHGRIDLSGGSLNGALTLAGVMDWTNGAVSGALTVASNGVLNLVSDTPWKYLYGVLTNAGAVHYPGSYFQLYGGAVYNLAGALFEVQADAPIYWAAWGTELFVNAGTLRKSAGTGATPVYAILRNTGTVDVQSGGLQFQSGGSLGGTFNVAEGADVAFAAGEFTLAPGVQFTGVGTRRLVGGNLYCTGWTTTLPLEKLVLAGGSVWFDGTTVTDLNLAGASFSGTNLTLNGTVNLSGGALYGYGQSLHLAGTVNASGGTLYGDDSTVSGTLNLSGGTLAGTNRVTGTLNWTNGAVSGALTVASNGVLNLVSDTPWKYLYGLLTNAGTVHYTGSAFQLDGYYGGGVIYNSPGGRFELQSDGYISWTYGNEAFHNAGLLRKSAGAGTTVIYPVFDNTGTVDVQTGGLQFQSSFTLAAGTLNLGLSSLTDFGKVGVSGTATLGGRLNVTLLNGYVPETNDTFQVMTFGATNRTFDDYSGLDAGSYRYFKPVFTETTLTLETRRAPIATNDAVTLNEDTVADLDVLANDNDAYGFPLSVASFTQGTHGTVSSNANGTLRYQPATNYFGGDTFTYRVSNGDGGSSLGVVSLMVLPANDPPVLAPIANRVVNEGTLVLFTNVATDVANEMETLTFSLVNPPAGATIGTTSGIFSWTPSEAQGPNIYTITVVVSDNGAPNLDATQSCTITVNEVNVAPTLPNLSPQTVNEGSLLTVNSAATDTDLPANTLTYSLLSPPPGASISADGVVTWTPFENQGPGVYTLTVKVTDNNPDAVNAKQLSVTNSFTVTVNEVNTAPVLTAPATQTINELATLVVTNLATDADIPANILTFQLVSKPTGMTITTNTGVITWTPTEAQGPSSNWVTVAVFDNGTPILSATQSFAVLVKEVNVAPVLPVLGQQTAIEGNLFTLNVAATDEDIPANALTYTLLFPPAGVSISSNGVVSWTPTQLQAPATHTLKVKVTDYNPDAVNAQQLSATNSYLVRVLPINHPPRLGPVASWMVDEMRLLTSTITATDPDAGDVLRFSLGAGAPAGAAIDPATGVFTWTPTEQQGPGTYTVTVTVTDNGSQHGSADLSDSQTFTITVREVNRPPLLAKIADLVVQAGDTVSFRATATDPDWPSNTLTYSMDVYSLIPPVPANATLNPASGQFSWPTSETDAGNLVFFAMTVTDNGLPPLASSQFFQVEVLPGVRVALDLTAQGKPHLIWNTLSGSRYQVQYKTDLNVSSWTDLGGIVTAAAATAEFVDVDAKTTAPRFYRVLLKQ